MSALDPDKYDLVPIGITKQGAWLSSGDPMRELRAGIDPGSMPRLSSVLVPDPSGEGRAELVQITPSLNGGGAISAQAGDPIDVIFPVLHGPYGEDGTVQGMLELAGIPYVGSGVLGSAVGMDKATMKRLFQAEGLPIVPFISLTRAEWETNPAAVLRIAESKLTYPMFAKPGNMGSSIGISKIHGAEEFTSAIDEAARYDRRIIIEQGIDARECECSVLGNDNPEVSVVGEVVPGNEFYDYRAKYVDGNSDLIIPANLPAQVAEEVRALALRAFKAIDAAGMARVDFFVARDFSAVWINEINTIPGFTRISMYPKLWEASGLEYPQLVERLIDLAIERYRDRSRSKAALSEKGADLSV